MRLTIRGLVLLSFIVIVPGSPAAWAASAPSTGAMEPAQMLPYLAKATTALDRGDLTAAKATLHDLCAKLGEHSTPQTRYVRRRVILVEADLLIGNRTWARERLASLTHEVIQMNPSQPQPPPAANPGTPASPAPPARS